MAGQDYTLSADRSSRVTFAQHVVGSAELAVRAHAHDQLRIAIRAGDEVTVLIRCDQWDVADIEVGELDAEDGFCLRLDVGPSGEAAVAALQQVTRRDRLAVGTRNILAHEDLLRRSRGVGLVLVDPRRGEVLGSRAIIRGTENAVRTGIDGDAGQRDVVLRARSRAVHRIVRRQRHVDGAIAALGDKIEAMIEELAEDRHPAIERRGEPFIRRNVRQEDGVAVHLDAVLRKLRIKGGLGQRVSGRGLLTSGRGRDGFENSVRVSNLAKRRHQGLPRHPSVRQRRGDGSRII
ncbi:hypothetical protein AEGHOMDF_2152 [Methylobacterium soli]|nr:hypothetical protein AEGHOMDF_2152 [Methylobacterium soli]